MISEKQEKIKVNFWNSPQNGNPRYYFHLSFLFESNSDQFLEQQG